MKIIGTYYLGPDKVKLYQSPGSDGSITARDGYVEMVIGIDKNHWPYVLSVLIHESMELAAAQMQLRVRSTDLWGTSSDSYIFLMTHPQFSEAVARSSGFMAACIPDLAAAFKIKHNVKGVWCR